MPRCRIRFALAIVPSGYHSVDSQQLHEALLHAEAVRDRDMPETIMDPTQSAPPSQVPQAKPNWGAMGPSHVYASFCVVRVDFTPTQDPIPPTITDTVPDTPFLPTAPTVPLLSSVPEHVPVFPLSSNSFSRPRGAQTLRSSPSAVGWAHAEPARQRRRIDGKQPLGGRRRIVGKRHRALQRHRVVVELSQSKSLRTKQGAEHKVLTQQR